MTSTTILTVFALVACLSLLGLSRLAARMTAADDHLAGASDMIEVGDALFTADEYARLVDLHNAYHSAPTTGGDAA